MRASDGESIAVWDQGGDGVPIIFLHGFPQNHRCWKGVISHLALTGRTMRCIAYDLRGHGESSKRGEASLQRLFQDHLDTVAALGIGRYHLVGHDWGGAIGLHVSRYVPEQLLSLVVMNTNYWKTNIFGMWHMLLFNAPFIARMSFKLAPNRMFTAFMVRSLMDDAKVDASTMDSYRAAFHDASAITYWKRLYRNMAKGIVRQALPRYMRSRFRSTFIKQPRTSEQAFLTPTLLIWGALDTFNRLAIGRDIETRLLDYGAQVTFKIVEQARHFVPEDQPEQVGQLISSHIEPFCAQSRG